jgi:broad specificity phosphatase PhoE
MRGLVSVRNLVYRLNVRGVSAASLSIVGTTIVFETHSTTEDNECGLATGWLPGRLSQRGRADALELGERRRDDDLAAVFTSDLARAAETTAIAIGSTDVPVLHDWRLRECDFGDLKGAAASLVHTDRRRWLDAAYPGGESWRQAIARTADFFAMYRQGGTDYESWLSDTSPRDWHSIITSAVRPLKT